MKEKNKKLIKEVGSVLLDTIGYTTSAISGVWMLISTHSFIKHGGIILYEHNPIISWLELGASIFTVGFCGYKLINEYIKAKEIGLNL